MTLDELQKLAGDELRARLAAATRAELLEWASAQIWQELEKEGPKDLARALYEIYASGHKHRPVNTWTDEELREELRQAIEDE